ncbi:MAG TPA: YdcF family protein [Flavobacteriales bacterium]|nr:YdcF family protein [Flavobacteriales bacterium]
MGRAFFCLIVLKKRNIFLLLCLLLLLGVGIFKNTFLRNVGAVLIVEDPLEKADAIFLLGGGSYDRGREAAKLFGEKYADFIICTGGQVSGTLKSLDLLYKEAMVSKIGMVKNHSLAPENIIAIEKGTSTREESELILAYCQQRGFSKIIVLSSKFHTRRVGNVFKPLFTENSIELMVHGAPSSLYKEDEWWKKEEGMIMVNNEYMKHLYYFFKY